MTDIQSWKVKGSYYEVCNCDAICPCRGIDGQPGGRSTTGVCEFALSWQVLEGNVGNIDLAGCSVAIAGYFTDDGPPDKPISPWKVVLYIDDRCSEDQALALERIFLGKAGGDTLNMFAGAFGDIIAVRRVRIELDHTPNGEEIRVGAYISAKTREKFAHDGTITCGIVSHDVPGTEVVAEYMRVNDDQLQWESLGKCGFANSFSYAS